MPAAPKAKATIYFVDGSSISVVETLQQITEREWPGPLGSNVLAAPNSLTAHMPDGTVVWFQLRNVTRIEAL